ncbi:MAG TPA: hypothetical protein VF529_10935 [Solirubrobacteraceae bacterium]
MSGASRRFSTWTAVSAALTAALALAPAVGHAAFPGRPGKLVFSSVVDG